jgi:hypothetical protein
MMNAFHMSGWAMCVSNIQDAGHTPASWQSRSRRQQVMPDPHPISCGSISQAMPLRSTKTMPGQNGAIIDRRATALRPCSPSRQQRTDPGPERIGNEGLCHTLDNVSRAVLLDALSGLFWLRGQDLNP